MSKKGLLAVGLLILSLVAVSAFSIQRFTSSGKKADDGGTKRVSDRPSAATTEPRKLEMPAPTLEKSASAAVAMSPRIPALVPTAAESAEPIGVRRTGKVQPGPAARRPSLREDAPVLLVSTRPGATGLPGARRPEVVAAAADQGQEADPSDPIAATTRNLQSYQGQLQGLLDDLTKTTAMAAGQATGAAPPRNKLLWSATSWRPLGPAVRPPLRVASSVGSSRGRPRREWWPRCWAIAASRRPKALPSPAR